MASTSKRSRPVSASPPAETLSKEERRAHKKAKKAELAALGQAATASSEIVEEPEVVEKEHKKTRKVAAVEESDVEEEEPVKATKEERRKRKEERKVAAMLGVQVADEPALKKHKTSTPADAERKAAKKERKRLAAEAAAAVVASEPEAAMDEDEVEGQRALRKAEKKARKLSAKLLAAAAEAPAAAAAVVKKSADKGKGKELALDSSLAEASMDDILAALQKPSRSSTLGAALKAHGASIPERKDAGAKLAPAKAKGAKKVVEKEAPIDFASLGAKDLLSSQWLPLQRIKELAEEHNFEYKKGKFSASEDALLNQTLTNYASAHGLSQEELALVIFTKGRTSRSSLPASSQFWPTIASALDGRPVLAVYNHVRRLYAPTHAMGAWTAEEDAKVLRGVKEHGTAWAKIAEDVGRSGGDCRDRWRNHLGVKKEGGQEVRKGKWDTEETEMLVEAVGKVGQQWTTVAEIVRTRSRHQCRIKWNDDVKRKLATVAAAEVGTAPPIWSVAFRPNLIIAVSNFAANDTTEIDWKQITDPFLAPHGPANLRKYWTGLSKKAVNAGVDGGHSAQVDWLLGKYPVGQAPKNIPTKAAKKPLKKKGKPVVESSSEDEDEPEEDEEPSSEEKAAPVKEVVKRGRGRPRKEVKGKEEATKSAQFVSDSDDE